MTGNKIGHESRLCSSCSPFALWSPQRLQLNRCCSACTGSSTVAQRRLGRFRSQEDLRGTDGFRPRSLVEVETTTRRPLQHHWHRQAPTPSTLPVAPAVDFWQEGSSLAADCAGGRAFRLGAESDGKAQNSTVRKPSMACYKSHMLWNRWKVWHVEPLGEASVGPIIFEPFQHAQCPIAVGSTLILPVLWLAPRLQLPGSDTSPVSHTISTYSTSSNMYPPAPRLPVDSDVWCRYRTTLYVRNNLTTLHQVELVGHGGSSRLVFPEGVLVLRRKTEALLTLHAPPSLCPYESPWEGT